MTNTIWKEINKIKNWQRRRYFMWKNGIDSTKMQYSTMSEEEIKEVLCKKDLTHLERWESSAEYKRLLFLLKEDSFATDLLDVYDATKDKAEDGDSQSIKNMIMLQKEIKNYRKSIDEFQDLEDEIEEDDGLVIKGIV